MAGDGADDALDCIEDAYEYEERYGREPEDGDEGALPAGYWGENYDGQDLYTFNEFYISQQMMHAIVAYTNHYRRPGHFLQAVICNDLAGALAYADKENLTNIRAFIGYFHNEAPSPCWGSKEKIEAWLKRKR